MFPYPYPVTNRGGIAEIATTGVNVTTTAVTFTLPNHAFFGKPYKGYFTLKIRNAIPTGTTTTLPLRLSSNDSPVNITALGGGNATVASLGIPATGAVLVYYDRENNLLQLV